MSINPTDPRSPSRQIADSLRDRITGGELAPGAALPSEREIVAEFGIAPQTARQAVALLKAEGLVVGVRGKGVFVREKPPIIRVGSDRFARHHRDSGKAAFQAEVESAGLQWRQEMLELAEVQAPKWVAEWFGIEPGSLVFVRRRRTWIENYPTQLADSYFRLDDVEGTAIREENTGPGGSYKRLEEKGYRLTKFREEIEARMPTPEESAALRLVPGTPVAELHRIAFAEETPVEVFKSVMAADRHVFAYEFPAPE
ncbi:GntR family transcriptional regulator [Kitasatospora fiedleri]|uniref:GntR family transcriptional regulator n=1 Tax=Kitasatospora fiedleri TaxID=2991545 RepID=UPI00249B6BCB|nr:GntR family transcriptional regulator [Kitasatospora fiedleri]